MWFWRLVSKAFVRGKTDWSKVQCLNQLLPPERSTEVAAARDKAREGLQKLSNLAIGGSVAALATLATIAETVGGAGRPSLKLAGYFFATAGICAAVASVLSVVEPAVRAEVNHRLDHPDEPMSDYEDWQFSEAVDNRLAAAPWIVRRALVWRFVAATKGLMLFACIMTFCAALLFAVGAV